MGILLQYLLCLTIDNSSARVLLFWDVRQERKSIIYSATAFNSERYHLQDTFVPYHLATACYTICHLIKVHRHLSHKPNDYTPFNLFCLKDNPCTVLSNKCFVMIYQLTPWRSRERDTPVTNLSKSDEMWGDICTSKCLSEPSDCWVSLEEVRTWQFHKYTIPQFSIINCT